MQTTMTNMSLVEYQVLAERTAKKLTFPEALVHGALGLTSEAGELATQVKAHVVYGKPLDHKNMEEELGDLLWFVAYMASTLDISLVRVAQRNIDKLRARYPDKYSDAAAIARADENPTTAG